VAIVDSTLTALPIAALLAPEKVSVICAGDDALETAIKRIGSWEFGQQFDFGKLRNIRVNVEVGSNPDTPQRSIGNGLSIQCVV
jgi:hypothetical protein